MKHPKDVDFDELSLGDKQRYFTLMVADLIGWAYQNGYELTFGDAYRDPRLHGVFGTSAGYGKASSCHKVRLAIDLNLFIDGVYQTDTEAYRALGEYWKSLNPACQWGGDFDDGNHFSISYNGFR